MATPGMSWQQHHYGGSAAGTAKFVPSPAAAQQAGHSMDYSQDLHLKMSKKIAQLTKVRAGVRAARGSPFGLGGWEPCAQDQLMGAVAGMQQRGTYLQEAFKLQ